MYNMAQWIQARERGFVSEKSESYEVEQPEPFERDERAKLVLDELQLTGADNEVMMVSCKVVGFTAEAKVQPAQYEQARGYVQLEPKDLWIHVPILKDRKSTRLNSSHCSRSRMPSSA